MIEISLKFIGWIVSYYRSNLDDAKSFQFREKSYYWTSCTIVGGAGFKGMILSHPPRWLLMREVAKFFKKVYWSSKAILCLQCHPISLAIRRVTIYRFDFVYDFFTLIDLQKIPKKILTMFDYHRRNNLFWEKMF